MSAWAEPRALALAALLATAAPAAQAGERYGLGREASPEEVAGWDIDVRPDGLGLPPGQGTALEGERVYLVRCAACHGEFGEGAGRYPVLIGGQDSLATDDPVKTIGSYWPYATTIFDYVRRAMPFGQAQTLSDSQVYAITAFLLYSNDIIDEDFVVDARTLPAIEMPNRDGFIADDRPDVPLGEPCMRDCRGPVRIVGRARQLDVTPVSDAPPEEAGAEAVAVAAASDPRGEQLFAQCRGCHSLRPGEHRVGPSLAGLFGRRAGSAAGYERYSAALRGSGLTWDRETLARFLTAPQALVAGTSMPFAGIADPESVAELVGYLERAAR